MRVRILKVLSVVMLALAGAVLGAENARASPEGWEALRQPGAIAIMRHAVAPGGGDPAGFRLDDCTTQRNLDQRGRAQARAVGAAFRADGIAVDRVMSSEWCRCRETAELLALGKVEAWPSLNSFFSDGARRGQQTAATRDLLASLPKGQRAVLVTHQVNISALTGAYPASGEIFVLQVKEGGAVEMTGRILIDP